MSKRSGRREARRGYPSSPLPEIKPHAEEWDLPPCPTCGQEASESGGCGTCGNVFADCAGGWDEETDEASEEHEPVSWDAQGRTSVGSDRCPACSPVP